MASDHHRPSVCRHLCSVVILCLIFCPLTSAFDRNSCLASTNEKLKNQTLSPASPLFYHDPISGLPYNGLGNMTVTLNGCYALCGTRQSWYKDIGPRLTTWFFPILILIMNIDLSPIDKRRFWAILHLLGDPIDTIWSLIHKIDAWDRCDRFVARHYGSTCCCRQVIATVLAGYEEVLGPRLDSEDHFLDIIEQRNLATQFEEWQIAATSLADARNDEFYRTFFAIFLYVLQLIAAFVPVVGGTPPGPPGGRVATAVLLSWLVCAALLSNMVGNLSSRRTAYDIMTEFVKKTGGGNGGQNINPDHSIASLGSIRGELSTEYFATLAWNGGLYTYRPWKLRYITATKHRNRYTLLLATIASMPLLIGFIGGVLILMYQLIVGFNCRHVWLTAVTLVWCLSAISTTLLYHFDYARGESHWRITLIKDACVAIPGFLIMFLSACGLFNFCWCWSGFPADGSQRRVPLVETVYYIDGRTIYPGIVGAVLTLMVTIVVLIAVRWRHGLRLLRWSERSRQQHKKHLISGNPWNCKHFNSI